MLAVALFVCLHTRSFLKSAATADGVVIENVYHHSSRGSGTYYPRVSFRTASGQDLILETGFGTRPPSYRAGERVQVFYDPGNPAHFSINSFWSLWFVPILFGGMGVVFSSIGWIPFAWQRRVRRRDDWLRANGQRIFADFECIELNTRVRMNGQYPWRIVCQWLDPASNQVRVYRSQNLWYDPARYITGKTMEVMVDPANPKRYVVETSFLPKLAE
jgi:hypothetical protein